MLLAQLLLCTLAPGALPETPLQLAVVFDSSLYDWRAHEADGRRPLLVLPELAALEGGLRGHGIEIALVRCRRGQSRARADDFKAPTSGLVSTIMRLASKPRRCRLDADVVGTAISQLSWQPKSKRRILVISRESLAITNGRHTLEEVMRDAEHLGIVVHGLSLSDSAGHAAAHNIMRDIRSFMKFPTAPLGRPVHHLRQGVLITGGSYYASVKVHPKALQSTIYSRIFGSPMTRRQLGSINISNRFCTPTCDAPSRPTVKEIRAKLAADLGIGAAYGLRDAEGRDVLDKLAMGELRPSEVDPSQLPKFLVQQDLEPLMDSIWDFVNARRAIQQILSSASIGLAAKGVVPPVAGRALAKDILAPPRFAPSRR